MKTPPTWSATTTTKLPPQRGSLLAASRKGSERMTTVNCWVEVRHCYPDRSPRISSPMLNQKRRQREHMRLIHIELPGPFKALVHAKSRNVLALVRGRRETREAALPRCSPWLSGSRDRRRDIRP